MPSSTQIGWEEDVIEELLGALRKHVNPLLKPYGPEPVLLKTDMNRCIHALDEVKALFEKEFGPKVKKNPRSMWPFNDPTIKLSRNFEAVYKSIMQNDELKPRKDGKTIQTIRDAGGRPYDTKAYGKNDWGDAVVQPNKLVIANQIRRTVRTVEREINHMVKAGALIPLKTARNAPSLYVIGKLQPYMGNNVKVQHFLNQTSRRDEITAAFRGMGF